MNPADTMKLALSCERFLSFDPRDIFPRRVLSELLENMDGDPIYDNYGEGELIETFEREIAEMLGKESAVFMPSGTMAQQIALRIWSDRRGSKHVAFHPKCHLEIHEQKGYQMLHGLHGVLVGNPNKLMTLADVKGVSEPLAALLLELPQREIGGVLPTWEELTELTGWAREQGIPLHMDGARLWESQPFYGRSYAEIAGLFDTVYVSFYKGLRGITGAILTGPKDFIREAKVWQRRYGGNLRSMWPYILSARLGFQKRLPRMAAYHQKALEFAEAISCIPGVQINPNPPHTHMMHVFLPGDPEKLLEARNQIAEARKIMLFMWLSPCQLPGYSMFELSIGDPSLVFEKNEVQALFEELYERAE